MASGIMYTTSSTNEFVQNIKIYETSPSASAYEFPLAVARGLISKHSWVLKSGKNSDVDTSTTPEDIWDGNGLYTGFPTGSPQVIQAFSSDAHDSGSLTITYLPTTGSNAYLTSTVVLQGTTPVDFPVSGIRVHTAYYDPGVLDAFNAGSITIRCKTSTNNVFLKINANTNQSYACVYTVPYRCTAYVYEVTCGIQGSASATVNGSLFLRTIGQPARLRRNFSASTGDRFFENLNGTLTLPALTDVCLRILDTSVNNLVVVGAINILVIQD